MKNRSASRGLKSRRGFALKPQLFAKQGRKNRDPFLDSPYGDVDYYDRGTDEYHDRGARVEGEFDGDDSDGFSHDYCGDPYCDECEVREGNDWTWQFLPQSLMYKTYLAGPKEPRLGTALLYNQTTNRWIMDSSLGARVGLIRFGTPDDLPPEGWQLDVEGAVFPRFDADKNLNLQSADVRFGLPLTWARGPYQAKVGFTHVSSHLGDDYMFLNPGSVPVNYVRNSMVLGMGYFLTDHFRMYGEAGYAFSRSGGAEEWEFQVGSEYLPLELGPGGAPFFAANSQFREENKYAAGLNVMAGWAWHGTRTDHILRVGAQYYYGKSSQYAFFRNHDELIGIGMWYDF